MSAEVRAMAGLGYPPVAYNQNANESINSAFKRNIDQKLSISECVQRIERFIKQQMDQVALALLHSGEFKLLGEYASYATNENNFYRMQEKGKTMFINKFYNADLLVPLTKNMIGSHDTNMNSDGKQLSVPLNKFCITAIPATILRNMYQQAVSLLATENSVTLAPGKPPKGSVNHHFVKNDKGNTCTPHYVKSMKSGIVCDDYCYRYQNSKLCSHILAVAELQGRLKGVLSDFAHVKIRPNITKMATHGVSPRCGKNRIKQLLKGKDQPTLK